VLISSEDGGHSVRTVVEEATDTPSDSGDTYKLLRFNELTTFMFVNLVQYKCFCATSCRGNHPTIPTLW